jgi:hypothetical protein
MKMRRAVPAVLLFLVCLAIPAFSQVSFPGADDAPKVTITGAINQRTGDDVTGTITAKLGEGWHINSNTPTEDFAITTVLELDTTTAELG